jgi:hypothetical protein
MLPVGAPDADPHEPDVPPPGLRGGVGRLRQRLDKVVTESIPLDGHGNGYGAHGNGHGNGHPAEDGEPAAVRSGGEQALDAAEDAGDGADDQGES